MRSRVSWVIAGLAVGLIATLVAVMLYVPPCEIRLEITGSPGTRVRGSYVADGVGREIDGTVPAIVACEARDFDFLVERIDRSSEIAVKIRVDDIERLSSSTTNGDRGVRGYIRYGRFGLKDGGVGKF